MMILGWPIASSRCSSPGDLDVVGLVAVEREPLGVIGHERVAVDLAPQPDVAAGRAELEVDGAELGDTDAAPVVVERALPQPLLADPVEVDVGDRPTRPVGEPFGLCQQVATLVDHRLPVPRQVRGRLPLAGRGEDVRRVAAEAGAADQQPTVLGPGDRDRAAGEVGEHGGARQCGLGARWHRHPHVLAYLDVQVEAGDVGRPEDQVGPERHLVAVDGDRGAVPIVTGSEPAALVELPVGRQVGLRRHAQHPAPVDHHGAVEHPRALHQRRTDHEHRHQVGTRRDDLGDRRAHAREQRVLQDQVVDRVAAQAQLREHRHRDVRRRGTRAPA